MLGRGGGGKKFTFDPDMSILTSISIMYFECIAASIKKDLLILLHFALPKNNQILLILYCNNVTNKDNTVTKYRNIIKICDFCFDNYLQLQFNLIAFQ